MPQDGLVRVVAAAGVVVVEGQHVDLNGRRGAGCSSRSSNEPRHSGQRKNQNWGRIHRRAGIECECKRTGTGARSSWLSAECQNGRQLLVKEKCKPAHDEMYA